MSLAYDTSYEAYDKKQAKLLLKTCCKNKNRRVFFAKERDRNGNTNNRTRKLNKGI